MRTVALAFAVALGLAPLAWAQPVPGARLEPAEEARVRADLRRLKSEYARYDLGATGLEGIWQVSLTRTLARSGGRTEVTPAAGEWILTRSGADVTIAGRLILAGRTTGKFEARGALGADGTLALPYKATVAGEGELRLERDGDGLRVRLAGKVGADDVRAEGTAARAVGSTRAELEAELFALGARLQAHRYPRPAPTRAQTNGGRVGLRFTPSAEHDPQGVEADVVRLIGAAERTIDLAVFEFSIPRVAEALVAAQERGVRVRMVYDSREDGQPALEHLKARGVPVRGDQRSTYMHNKFMVIDGKTVWTGSTNMSPNGVYISDNAALTFQSAPLAAQYTTEFEEMFVHGQFGTRSPANTSRDWIRVDASTRVQVFFAPEDNAMDRLIQAVRGARRSVKVLAFAFTSEALYQALVERIQAGVKVEVVFESLHAGWRQTKTGPLHAAGASVRFDKNPDAMHHKVVVIDDRIVCTGSFNFSDGADRQNDENLLVVQSAVLARAFAREFRAIFDVCDPNDPRLATSGMAGRNPDGSLSIIDAIGGEPEPGP